jgi:hypothetical protein
MSKPHHGNLFQNVDQEWIFCPGASTDLNTGIVLSNLPANCQHLLDTCQLFRGYTKLCRVYQTRNQARLRACVLCHVTAHGFSPFIAPSSLKQISLMTPDDQAVRHDASSLPITWGVITEEQLKCLSKGTKTLPSLAIATIKYNEFNRPKRAKDHIIVLGNLDYHNWSKKATAAPVMSQLELHILTSLVAFHKRVLKNCEIKQAFVQSSLPLDELYFVKPHVGCPRSKPGTYWHLLWSLYGLKRAPKVWFEK